MLVVNSLCKNIFLIFFSKFPVLSLSGKMDFQIPCFPCAVATLNNGYLFVLPIYFLVDHHCKTQSELTEGIENRNGCSSCRVNTKHRFGFPRKFFLAYIYMLKCAIVPFYGVKLAKRIIASL